MKKFLLGILAIFFLSCASTQQQVQNMNKTSELADLQDSTFAEIKRGRTHFTKKDVKRMNPLYIKTAAKLAPGNLVVRSWILMDLMQDTCAHRDEVLHILDDLTYGGKIWAEGYSYWKYTKPFLVEYGKRFPIWPVDSLVVKIDKAFVLTSYKRKGILYPAPFGDLRDEPLEEILQWETPTDTITIGPIKKAHVIYTTQGWPVGLNPHVPNHKKKKYISVMSGRPDVFEYYTGYGNKYDHFWQEWTDVLAWRRIKSVFSRKK